MRIQPRLTARVGKESPDVAVAPPKSRILKSRRLSKPPMYRVVMLNDDFTPMEFVVQMLQQHFDMPEARAVEVMLTIHTEGSAVVGVYSYDIAETKASLVMTAAKQHRHPLRCLLEAD